MRRTLYIASAITVVAGFALFAMDSENVNLPGSDIDSSRKLTISSPSKTLSSDSATDSIQLSSIYDEVLIVGRGDTLMALLVDADVAPANAEMAIRAMSQIYKPRQIKPGQKIVLSLKPKLRAKTVDLVAMKISPNVEQDIFVTQKAGNFEATVVKRPLTKLAVHSTGTIESSLYVAGIKAGLHHETLAEFIQIFSFDVDFQRDIRHGDGFDVIYEEYLERNGAVVKAGNILVAEMTLSGKKNRLYRYKTRDGFTDYYNSKGQSVRKALLRTPIDGARISSGFGKRRHPILGYTRMHKGLDFAARRGTPVYAAGDGFVEYAGRKGSYGKYIRLRHNGSFKTAYAHMHRYARGIRNGRRVHQGQIIGYVGSTGRSTGPHLHYEVHKNGRQVNPRSIKLPAGRNLTGHELRAFKTKVAKLKKQYANLTAQKLAKNQ